MAAGGAVRAGRTVTGRPVWEGCETAMVRVLDEDPDLAQDLCGRTLMLARSAAIAPLRIAPVGPFLLPIGLPATRGHLGALVLDGLLARDFGFGGLGATELVGPGDVLLPRGSQRSGLEAGQEQWRTLAPTRLAELDRDFVNRVTWWPELIARVVERGSRRVDSQLLRCALSQELRVEDRVLVTLWHFADRWGRIGTEGRVVRLPHVTGNMLANVVGARRQSVSAALASLIRSGALRRRPDGTWVLPRRPPQLGPFQTSSTLHRTAGAMTPH